MTALVLAVCNQKGGVGKTTTTYHLARAAITDGLRVLVVDADPQGDLTSVTVGEDSLIEGQVGLADVLSDRSDEHIRDVIVPGIWPGLDVVPTTGDALEGVNNELVIAGAGREQRLHTALADVIDDYDVVLIDCPPALNPLTINALTAAQGAVVVTESRLFATNGLSRLLHTIDTVQTSYNQDLAIAGILINEHKQRTISGRTWKKEVDAVMADRQLPILDPPIPDRVAITDAEEASCGLDEWAGRDGQDLADLYTAHLHTIQGGLS